MENHLVYPNRLLRIVAICLLCLFPLSNVDAQKENNPNRPSPLSLHLTIDGQTTGKDSNLFIRGKLENLSSEPVVVDKRNFWRYVSIKALPIEDKAKANRPFSAELVLNRYLTAFGDNFEDSEGKISSLIRINPNSSIEDTLKISLKEKFFQVPGQYTLKSSFRQYKSGDFEGTAIFVGEVESNELVFHIRNCRVVK